MSCTDLKVAFATLGCKLNTFESQAIGSLARDDGMTIVPFEDEADVYIINTCTVTQKSDYKSRQLARRARRRSPTAKVVMTGCYAERDPEGLAQLPDVDLVVGNPAKLGIPELLRRLDSQPRIVRSLPGEDRTFPPRPITNFGDYSRAFLKVQDGCNFQCTFCAIQVARGRSRSLPLRTAVEHAHVLVDAGYPEIILTGVDPGDYGRDLPGRPTLGMLVEALTEVAGLERVRLSSVGAQDYDDHLVDLVTAHPQVARHVHLPVQSGSDAVLTAMRRGSRRKQIDALLDRLVERAPGIRVGGDFMVGFPTESPACFEETLAMVQDGPWSYGHVFPFSGRPGTRAAEIPDEVGDPERKQRSRVLRDLLDRRDESYRRDRIGTDLSVLVEESSQAPTGFRNGVSSEYIRVQLPENGVVGGQIIDVRVEGVDGKRTIARTTATVV